MRQILMHVSLVRVKRRRSAETTLAEGALVFGWIRVNK